MSIRIVIVAGSVMRPNRFPREAVLTAALVVALPMDANRVSVIVPDPPPLALENAGRALEETAGLVKSQDELFERTIGAARALTYPSGSRRSTAFHAYDPALQTVRSPEQRERQPDRT